MFIFSTKESRSKDVYNITISISSLENIFGFQKTGETNMLSLVPENTTITSKPLLLVVVSFNTTFSPSISLLPSFLVNKPKNVVNKKTFLQELIMFFVSKILSLNYLQMI